MLTFVCQNIILVLVGTCADIQEYILYMKQSLSLLIFSKRNQSRIIAHNIRDIGCALKFYSSLTSFVSTHAHFLLTLKTLIHINT